MTADDVESLRAAFQATRGCRYYILQVDGLVHATHVGYNTGNDGITITRVLIRICHTESTIVVILVSFDDCMVQVTRIKVKGPSRKM